MDIVCAFKGQCADEGACCAVCQNNMGKRSHFKPDITPVYPDPVPWYPVWPNYPQPYIGDWPPYATWITRGRVQ